MKTKFLLLATALFCLASCNNAELDNNVVDLGGNSSVSPSGDVYTIEIEGSEPGTKGTYVSKTIGLADLVTINSPGINAQLLKNGNPFNDGVTYSWSGGNTYYNFSGNNSATGKSVSLKGVKSTSSGQKITVSASIGGTTVATNDKSTVKVEDNIDIHWDKTSIELKSGESPQKLSLYSNVSNVTVTCPSNCKIGKSSDVSTGDETYQFSSAGSQDVYVKYTGTSDASLSLKAASGSHSASTAITAKKEVVKKKVTLNYSCYESEIKSTISVGSYATSTQYWVSCKQKVYCWDENGQLLSDTFASYYSWKGGSLSKIMSDHNKGLNYSVETKTLETSSSKIYIGFAITTNGLYVDDSNNKKMFPTGSYQADSDYFPVSLSLPSSSKVPTTTANPYGIASNQMQCIYEVSVSGDMTLTVTKGM